MTRKPSECHVEPANFSPSEIAAVQPDEALAAPDVDKILDGCRGCRALQGDFVSYNKKAGRVLGAVLTLLRLLDAIPELIDVVRAEACRDLERQLSRSKLYLICLYMCVDTSDEDVRKTCSKFSKIVGFAHADGVEPQDAIRWLKSFRIAKAAERRAQSSCSTHFSIRFSLGAFPSLAKATNEGKGWPVDPRVSAELAAAAQRCEQLLRETVSSDESTAVESTT